MVKEVMEVSTIFATYTNCGCDNCRKYISVGEKTPAFVVTPYEELPNIELFLCEECARKIRNDYTVERYFQMVDEAKRNGV